MRTAGVKFTYFNLWSDLLWLGFRRVSGSGVTEREAALLTETVSKEDISGLSGVKSSKLSPQPAHTCLYFTQFCLCTCACVCVHAVGGLFLSLQCSLPAGGDDDRSPVLCSEPGG